MHCDEENRAAAWLRGSLAVAVAALFVGILTPQARASVAVNEVYSVPADRVFDVVGRGFGHGHGMSQYGAKGRAEAGQSLATILGFYYPGTSSASMANRDIDVAITDAGLEGITTGDHRYECDYSSAGRTNCGVVVVPEAGLEWRRISSTTWAALPGNVGGVGVDRWGAKPSTDGSALQLMAHTVNGVWSPYGSADAQGLRFRRSGATVRLRFLDGSTTDYPGYIDARRTGADTIIRINVLPLETYLRGVVPSEMPASWHPVAVQAQSVAARTYAGYERSSNEAVGRRYDTCDSTSCQVYRGHEVWAPASDQAIANTAQTVRMSNGSPAFAQFSASNGGYMSAGSQPYLAAGSDPYDQYPQWTASLSAASLESRFPAIGSMRRLVVTQREASGATWKGRIVAARLEGSAGSVDVTGDNLRSVGGLKSTFFTIQLMDPHDLFGAAAYSAGGADLVSRSETGAILHRSWRDSLRPFVSLGGGTDYAPAVAFAPPSRLDAVVTGSTGSLYVNSRPTASQAWTGWLNMAGSAIGRPAVVSASGYLDMYAHGTAGGLWNRYRRPDSSWSAWRNLGAVPIAATAGLSATSTGDGRHLVVARDGDGSLLLLTRTLSSGQLAITDLGGGLLADPTITSARAGRATIALRGTNNDLYVREVTGAAVGGWLNLGGDLGASPVTFAYPGSDRVDVLVNDQAGTLQRRTRTGSTWSAWTVG